MQLATADSNTLRRRCGAAVHIAPGSRLCAHSASGVGGAGDEGKHAARGGGTVDPQKKALEWPGCMRGPRAVTHDRMQAFLSHSSLVPSPSDLRTV